MIVKQRVGHDSHVGERGLKLFGGQRGVSRLLVSSSMARLY
jgi:ABC-type transport system involved in Fe-S cluster assembly fused permease/ATPase subunit